MPRIRSIKPDFFTDSKTGTLPSDAAKLYIGLWCHADDFGIVPYDPLELKAKILPYAPLEVADASFAELLKGRLLIPFLCNEGSTRARRGLDEEAPLARYLWLPTFTRHQKVDRPSAPFIPEWVKESTPLDWPGAQICDSLEFNSQPTRRKRSEGSTRARRGLAQERKGEELGEERKGEETFSEPSLSLSDPIQQIYEAWMSSLPEGTQRELTVQRRSVIKATLAKGFPLKDCLDAVRGWQWDDWDRRLQNNDLEDCLRPSNREKFRDWERGINRPQARSNGLGNSSDQAFHEGIPSVEELDQADTALREMYR